MADYFERIAQLLSTVFSRKYEVEPYSPDEPYSEYIEHKAVQSAQSIENRQHFNIEPLISVICPVDYEPQEAISKTLCSLREQYYQKFELILAFESNENQVKDMYKDGLSVKLIACNGKVPVVAAAGAAKGDYYMFIVAGDILQPNALHRFVEGINFSFADFLYADEDSINIAGIRHEPIFKPEYSPETLLSYNYIGLPNMASRNLYIKCAGLREWNSKSRYDYVLRCTQASEKVAHIPEVLYTRSSPEQKIAPMYGRGIIDDHLKRLNQTAYSVSGIFDSSFRVRSLVKNYPLVSIIIHSKDDFDHIKRLIESIDETSTYDRYELLVIDMGSTDSRTTRYYKALNTNKAAKVLRCAQSTTVAQARNMTALCAKGAVLIFMDPHLEVLTPDWIEALFETAQLPEAGAVGCKLLYEGNRIYHAGIVVGINGLAGYTYRGDEDKAGQHRRDRFINTLRNVSAVSGECIAIEAQKFSAVRQFDEAFKDFGADIDICLRLLKHGYRNLYTPYASLIRHEAEIFDINQVAGWDKLVCYEAFKEMLMAGDPNYSPNYDYRYTQPLAATQPQPPIWLNACYTKQ